MKIIYLLIVHKNFDQVFRVIERLNIPDSHFLIHVDQKVKSATFQHVVKVLSSKPNITYMDRQNVTWGAIGLTQVMCDAFALLIQRRFDFNFLVILSGQDYPIKTNDHIFATLCQYQGKQFIEQFPIPRDGWGIDSGRDRYERYHFRLRNYHFCYPPISYSNKKYGFLRDLLPHERRTIPGNLSPHGGSALFTLSKTGVEFLVDYFSTPFGKRLFSFFRTVNLPEEVIFQTVLVNSDLKDTLINDNLQYIDWEAYGQHPSIMTTEYFDALRKSEALFSRKFDITVDSKILDQIDHYLLCIR